MEKATNGPAKALDIDPDSWERFKSAVSIVVRTPPQHRASARGTGGRRSKLSSFQRAEAIKRCEAGEPQSAIARTYGVDQCTISRLFKARSA
jgi:hypothetical protein